MVCAVNNFHKYKFNRTCVPLIWPEIMYVNSVSIYFLVAPVGYVLQLKRTSLEMSGRVRACVVVLQNGFTRYAFNSGLMKSSEGVHLWMLAVPSVSTPTRYCIQVQVHSLSATSI